LIGIKAECAEFGGEAGGTFFSFLLRGLGGLAGGSFGLAACRFFGRSQ
jgi:hypothetical protein